MTKKEFKKCNFTQVRRTNLPNSKVLDVNGVNSLEGLVTTTSGEYIRYENLEIITTR